MGWATGEFGTAVSIGRLNSNVVIPNIAVLDGSTEMTMSVWVYWNGLNGKYPNVLTGGWSPGGFMFFVNEDNLSFRLGRRGHRAGKVGDRWEEGSCGMGRIPLRKWTHLAATFSLPNVTTYMDGKKVGHYAWQYPIGFTDPLVLGQWNTEKSHDGLIDEVRLYKRALTPAEVALLAERKGRDSGEIKVVPPVRPRTLASFETRCATLTLNEAGWVTSLLRKASGKEGPARELLAAETPMVTVVLQDNRNVECHKMSVDNGILTATFPGLDGHARLRCESKGDYLKFTALEVTVPRVTSFVFFHCAPGVNQYRGEFAGLVSDDDSGICLRALDLQVNCSTAMQRKYLRRPWPDRVQRGPGGRSAVRIAPDAEGNGHAGRRAAIAAWRSVGVGIADGPPVVPVCPRCIHRHRFLGRSGPSRRLWHHSLSGAVVSHVRGLPAQPQELPGRHERDGGSRGPTARGRPQAGSAHLERLHPHRIALHHPRAFAGADFPGDLHHCQRFRQGRRHPVCQRTAGQPALDRVHLPRRHQRVPHRYRAGSVYGDLPRAAVLLRQVHARSLRHPGPAGSSRSGSASRCCSPPFRPTPPRRGRSSTSATHR